MFAGRVRLLLPCKEALKRIRFDPGFAELACRFRGRGEAFDLVAALLRTLADGRKGARFSGARKPLKSVYPVGTCQHLADGRALRVVQKIAGLGLLLGGTITQHRFSCVSSVHDVLHVRTLGRDGLGSGEAAAGTVLLALDRAELTFLSSPLELALHFGKADFAHTSAQGLAHDDPLIGDGLALENLLLGEGHGSASITLQAGSLRLAQCTLPRCCDDSFRLVAEVRGHLFMRCQHLGGREGLLTIARRMCGDLRGLWSLETGALHLLFDLLRAWARRVKVRLRIALYFRCAALAWLDLVAQLAKVMGQHRLIDGGRIVLRLKECPLLDGARRTVLALGDIEDDGMRVELGRGVAVHRPSAVSCSNFAAMNLPVCSAGLLPPIRACVYFSKLFKCCRHGGTVSLFHALVATHERGQRDGLGRGKGCIPPGAMLDRLRHAAVCVGVLLPFPVLHHLLFGLGMLGLRSNGRTPAEQTSPDKPREAASLPCHSPFHGVVLLVVALGIAGVFQTCDTSAPGLG